MKTANDPRHKKRQQLLEELFKREFHNQPISSQAKEIFAKKQTIDDLIRQVAPEFPIEKINRVDLAILRLAVYEMTVDKKQPAKVVVDEAVELAKEYGGESSPGFVNGALGKLLKNYANTPNI